MARENILNNENQNVLIGAAKLMEDVFQSGLYGEMKTAEKKLKSVKDSIRRQLEDGESKRYELANNLIAKFIPFPVYETDELGLKEFLDDYGLLPETTTLTEDIFKDNKETLEELTPFQRPSEYFPQFYLNNNGRAHLDKGDYSFEDGLEHLTRHFIKHKASFECFQNKYKGIMKEIESCPFLRQAKEVKTTYGTCKLRKKNIEFNTNSVYTELGNEFLLNYGQVSLKSIDTFIAKGYFSSKDIQRFRRMKDLNLRFVIMDREAEIKQSEFFQHELMKKAQMRRFA